MAIWPELVFLDAHLFLGGEIRALWNAPMHEMLPGIEYEGNYRGPISPFVTTFLFCTSLVGRGKLSKFNVGPVTAKFENCCSTTFKSLTWEAKVLVRSRASSRTIFERPCCNTRSGYPAGKLNFLRNFKLGLKEVSCFPKYAHIAVHLIGRGYFLARQRETSSPSMKR